MKRIVRKKIMSEKRDYLKFYIKMRYFSYKVVYIKEAQDFPIYMIIVELKAYLQAYE